jgi:SurA N-terminal domain
MTRKRLVVLGGVALAAGGVALGLVLGGSDSNPPVAHVGSDTIRRDQLDVAVDHFRLAARDEGTPLPDEQDPRFRVLRNRILGVLVYRAEIAQAARRLGIGVSNIQVLRRMNQNGEGGEGPSADQFTHDTVKTQLLYERIYADVTRGITAPTTAERAARRNGAMKRYVDRLERETKVRYEPGYAPGP